MTTRPELRVLFFDVFGTCVAQRRPVADELSKAAKEALELNVPSISDEVRNKATNMSYEEWFELGGDWNEDIDKFTKDMKAKTKNVDWRAVDAYRVVSLHKLLAQRGMIIPSENGNSSKVEVATGSLWNESQLQHLSRVWQRLTPWPDTIHGLEMLNKQFSTVALSNTYNDLLKSLVSYSSIPFTQLYSSDMFQSYKPNPKVYLGAAEKMGVKPEECGLVASHLNDLKGAKACGFYAIYTERALEEKNPELHEEGIPDMIVKEDEGGFVTLAERLGTQR